MTTFQAQPVTIDKLNLLASDGTPRTFTLSEIAAHYAHHCSLKRAAFIESLDDALQVKLLQQTNSTTIEEDQRKMYDCDYRLMVKNYDECFEWATGKMGFHLSEEDQKDYDCWLNDREPRARGTTRVSQDWHNYRDKRAAHDMRFGYGWWNIEPVWLKPFGYEPPQNVERSGKKRRAKR